MRFDDLSRRLRTTSLEGLFLATALSSVSLSTGAAFSLPPRFIFFCTTGVSLKSSSSESSSSSSSSSAVFAPRRLLAGTRVACSFCLPPFFESPLSPDSSFFLNSATSGSSPWWISVQSSVLSTPPTTSSDSRISQAEAITPFLFFPASDELGSAGVSSTAVFCAALPFFFAEAGLCALELCPPSACGSSDSAFLLFSFAGGLLEGSSSCALLPLLFATGSLAVSSFAASCAAFWSLKSMPLGLALGTGADTLPVAFCGGTYLPLSIAFMISSKNVGAWYLDIASLK
mmetsp:Transcript_59106/g.145031  ORF Transcript_59106/g.145031 Transcript_59106/m.145031 type:complete len:287 (-) Transcript_59106:576-1436(-)